MLRIIKPQDEQAEHKPICSIDGEPWPCQHRRVESHAAAVERYSVRCLACGQLRNAWGSLTFERGNDGRMIYFHARKRCIVKARQWWAENVEPYTGERFICGLMVQDLPRYIGLHCKPKVIG